MKTGATPANLSHMNGAALLTEPGAWLRSRYQRPANFVISALVVTAPAYLPNPYLQHLASQCALFAMLALGLNLLFGFAGQISLGHAAFYGLGAYSAALLETSLGWSWWWAWPTAILCTMLVALAISYPILRLSGHYLALATLAFGLIVQTVLAQAVSITGGSDGIVLEPTETVGVWMNSKLPYVILLAAVACFWLCRNLTEHSIGRALRAIRDDGDGAAALGIAVSLNKTIIFVIAAGMAAAAGVLFAHYARVITPESFGVNLSILVLLMIVLGGMGSNFGSLAGAIIVVVAPQMFEDLKQYQHLAYALLVLVILLFQPGGLAGMLTRIRARTGRRQLPGTTG